MTAGVNLAEEKAALRRELRARLAALPAAARAAQSAQVCAALRGGRPWRQAGAVLAFMARPDEPDLRPLLAEALAAGRRVFLPRFAPGTGAYEPVEVRDFTRDLAPGRFGLVEPAPALPAAAGLPLDLALVPGLAFDAAGRRLGRGQGFFDRLLAGLPGARCGVCFAEQLCGRVPAEPHDVRMEWLAAPDGVRRAAPAEPAEPAERWTSR